MEEEKEYLSPREQTVLGRNPAVTKKEFVERLWKLRPVGNIEDAYINVCFTVKNVKQFDGSAITFDLIATKYEQYLRRERIKETDPKFIRGIASFVVKGGYNDQYEGVNQGTLNRYL